MKRAESSRIDLRALPQTPPPLMEREEREEPAIDRSTIRGSVLPPEQNRPSLPERSAPAPPPLMNFNGLDFANWGNGHPPDTNGDVGPAYYIQTVNTSIGIFRKSDGVRVAAFSFNTFMSQGHFGNLCDTNNFGDPVVLYDSFEDRWIISDFAFQLSGNDVVNPPGNFQCFAASMSGDPVSGGWNFYSINTADGLGDYPKLGIWPDGLYMSVNMFDYAGNGDFQSSRVYALNKAQMYAGKSVVQVLTFNAPVDDFTILPGNARLQAGTPPPGTPNYFVSSWEFLDALTVYKFHVDWAHPAASTFTGPDSPFAATSWPNADVPNAPSQGGSALDVLEIRAMVQNQYSNLGGVESLWVPHTVRRADINGFAAPRWYQVDVTGGVVNDNLPQAATWDPDGANVIYRFMPSVAVDRLGDMALGYSTSSSTTKPALKYAGRLAGDPINTFSQTEQVLFQGAGTQTGINRWGDYSAMSLDPDGCTFWYTNEYYGANGSNWLTRIGSFVFPSCTALGAGGTLSGTVTAAVGGAPIGGATVTLGNRTTTTNGSGVYSFLSLPAGTYPAIAVTDPGYNPASANSIVVSDGNTTTQNFALTLAPTNGCPSDTTQSDFQTGVPSNVDVATSPGDVILLNPAVLDQQSTTLGDSLGNISGGVITSTAFGGQTFTAAVSGKLHAVDINLFCNNCTGNTPNLTVSVRATSGGLPTGADLASTTIPGFNNGTTAYYTATFSSPATLAAGTKYALIVRPVANPSVGSYALSRSGSATAGSDVYAGGSRISDSSSGTTWSIPLTGSTSTDAGFRTYMLTAFASSGDLISSARDSNPAPGLTSLWSTLSWTAATPAQTSLKFQVAGSNSADGPFNFVGPDGTATTFFTTSGASLSQFNGLRYLKYRAYLATTNTAITPALNDVTICYAVADCSIPAAITSPAQACPNSTGNTASGPAGATSYSWSITNGTITGGASSQTVTYTAGASGSVGLTLNIVEALGCHKSGSVSIPIPPKATITPGGPTTFCAGGSVILTSSRPAGNQWYLNGNPIGGATSQTYIANASGNYTVTGDGCTSNASTITAVTVNPIPAAPTITPGGPTTFCTGGGVTLTSSNASGNQWFLAGNPIVGATNQAYTATASGNYTVGVTVTGCSSAPSAITAITVNSTPFTPTITAGGPTTFCAGGSVTLTSGSTAGNQWYLNGTAIPSATNTTYVASAAGDYTLIVTTTGCTSNTSAATTVTLNPLPAAPVITPGGPTTFCAGGSVTLTSSTATGNQWLLNGSPIGGATNQAYVASATGNYTVTVTASGCTSPASAATLVTVNPIPPAPAISGTASFCPGGSTTLTSSATSGNQWFLNGNPIGGATSKTYVVTAAGSYTVTVTTSGCTSAASTPAVVTVNPIPSTPSASNGGPYCLGGTISLSTPTLAGATYAWTGPNGFTSSLQSPTRANAAAADFGNYSVTVTVGGCPSAAGTTTVVLMTGVLSFIFPSGPTTFCAGGSVTLNSNFVSGNQWLLNGTPIPGATNQTYVASASGSYTHIATVNGCSSPPSNAIVVTANPNPSATITVLSTMPSTTSTTASVADAGVGATYLWTISGGTITAGAGTRTITFTAGSPGTLNLTAKVTTAAGCIDTKPASVTVTVPPVTVTSIAPVNGSAAGGTPVTINGTGFLAGAQVKIGGTAATNVVVASAIKITARTSAHAAGAANVAVTNPDTSTGTLTNGYAFLAHQFDANGDTLIDSGDIFYLVKFLFQSGPAPKGVGGMLSGDANGDALVDSGDIFYLVKFLFLSGPAPFAAPPSGHITTTSIGAHDAISGTVRLGESALRDGRYVVPVIMALSPGSAVPQALSLKVTLSGGEGALSNLSIRRAGVARNLQPVFESSDRSGDGLYYLVSYNSLDLGNDGQPAVVAEVEIGARNAAGVTIDLDPRLTMLSNQGGTRSATVANGSLHLSGVTIEGNSGTTPNRHRNEMN